MSLTSGMVACRATLGGSDGALLQHWGAGGIARVFCFASSSGLGSIDSR